MKTAVALLVSVWLAAGLAACETQQEYDGVSRFAGGGERPGGVG